MSGGGSLIPITGDPSGSGSYLKNVVLALATTGRNGRRNAPPLNPSVKLLSSATPKYPSGKLVKDSDHEIDRRANPAALR